MSENGDYRNYISSEPLYESHSDYAKKYVENARESDKVIINIVDELKSKIDKQEKPLSLLDIGCSTGNLLRHFVKHSPELKLFGGDLMAQAIEECRNDPELSACEFAIMDISDLPSNYSYDIVIANAIFMFLDDDLFKRALESAFGVLKNGGYLIAFDYFHAYPHELDILEKTKLRPNGVHLFYRSYTSTNKKLAECNFSDIEYRPFNIPFDLTGGKTFGESLEGFEDLNSYTIKKNDGNRLIFRGSLCQPWCHLIARKNIAR